MKVMKVNDKLKMRVISCCDKLKPRFTGTIYSNELRAIRTRYIYKDICLGELKKDVNYLSDLIKLSKIN